MTDLSQPNIVVGSLERRIMELTILHEVSRALQKTVDQETALYIILVGVTAGGGLGFNRAFVLLLDDEGNALHGQLAIGPRTPEEASSIWQNLGEKDASLSTLLNSIHTAGPRKDKWINELVSRIRIPLRDSSHPLIRILKSHEASHAVNGKFMPHGFTAGEQVVALFGSDEFAVAPLFIGEKDLGLLIADNAITRAPIETANLRLLEIFAQEASATIQNTRLYRRLREQIRISEETNATLRESQEQLLQVERLSTMGRLATLMAFRIRAPLASIGGFTRRLLRTMPPEDPRREEMEIIVSDVSRLERLVQEVLAYRRVSKSEFKPTDVNALIRSVLITMQDEIQRNSVRPILRLKPDVPVARIDELQVRQALMNLAANALEAMPAGGTLTITSSSDGEFLEIEVSDTGVGIPNQNWNKLFKPFFTTKTTGTGLGLAIVSQVVENHRGSLRFRSTPGEGTTFFMRLAIHPQEEGEFAPSSRSAAHLEEFGK